MPQTPLPPLPPLLLRLTTTDKAKRHQGQQMWGLSLRSSHGGWGNTKISAGGGGGGVATVGASFGTDEAGRSGFGPPVPRSGDGGADDAASGLRKRPRRIWGGESNPLRPNGNEIDSTVAKSVACVALESRARAGGARRRRRGRRAWAVGGGGQFSYIINMYIL